MQYVFLTVIIASSFSNFFAQGNDTINYEKFKSKTFVYSYEDKLVACTKVEIVKKLFEPIQIIADGRKLDANKIKFIKNDEGFFANVQSVSGNYEPEFYSCDIEGKINLFSKSTDYGSFINPTTGAMQSSSTSKAYINKGFGNLQKMNVKNVTSLTSDNPECVAYMKKVKLARRISLGIFLTGAAILVPSSVIFISDGSGSTGIAVGAGMMLLANFSLLFIPKPAKAIMIYNAK